MKKITLIVSALALLISYNAFSQEITTDISKTVEQQKEAVRNAEAAKKDIERQSRKEIARYKDGISRSEDQLKDLKARKKKIKEEIKPEKDLLKLKESALKATKKAARADGLRNHQHRLYARLLRRLRSKRA